MNDPIDQFIEIAPDSPTQRSIVPQEKGDKRLNIVDLPNFGSKSQQILEQAGIRTVAQLRKLGAVRAYVQVKSAGKVSLNLLWAIEGAPTDTHWQVVAKRERLRLLLELEDVEKAMTV